MCLEGVEVEKQWGLQLPPNLGWKMLKSFAMWLRFFVRKRSSRQKKEGFLALASSKWHWHNHVKTHWLVFVNIQIPQLLMGGIDWWGVGCNNSFIWLELHRNQWILELHKINEVNPLTLSQQWQRWQGCKCHIWWAQC